MFKLLDKGTDFTRFACGKRYDFPPGLVLFDETNFPYIIGHFSQEAPSFYDASEYYTPTWVENEHIVRWEMWAYLD